MTGTRTRASVWHLAASVGIATLVGGGVGYFFTGFYFDPFPEQIESHPAKSWQTRRIRTFFRTVGITSPKRNSVAGSAFEAIWMMAFLIRARRTEREIPSENDSARPK
ncbi:MAG: hypothetical protein ACPL7D_05665 [Candidatus Sumerlaeaceae bacterium]